MARKRKRAQVYSIGRHVQIPHSVLHSPQYRGLSGNAVKLLVALAMQYNGGNNGDLTAAWSLMKQQGFKSQTTLNRCLNELLESCLVVRTREGRFGNRRGEPALYAVTWHRIDHCRGKHDYPGSEKPPIDWTKREAIQQ